MSLIDAVPHPQAVFVGFDESDGRLETMASLTEGSLVLSDGDLGARRKLDWDLWVQRGGEIDSVPEHMHVLAFAATRLGLITTSYGGTSLSVGRQNHSPTMRIAPGLPEEVERLVRNELVPWLRDLPARPVLTVYVHSSWAGGQRAVHADDSDSDAIPFVLDADDNVIAGAFRRDRDKDAWIWVLPHDAPRPELWLAAALRDWHQRTPGRIPSARPWQGRANWMTRAEIEAERELEALEGRRTAWEARYAARRETLEAKRLRVRGDAEHGMRRLLTAHDDDLVDAVADALRYLGYVVTDEDEQRVGENRGKAHDLNVIDPDVPDRTVIAEVKGFTKGARGALAQAQQHILRYAVANHGRTPDRCWLLVNHFRERDPDDRPQLLQGADEDISIFADNGGVLMDSRDLFTIIRNVEDGCLTKADARRRLTQCSGRLPAQDV